MRTKLSVLISVLAFVASTAIAGAAESWRVAESRGTVFSLVDRKWEEIVKGETLAGDQVIRTLQGGRLQLDADGARLDLGGGTAIEIRAKVIKQYSGSLSVESARGVPLKLAAPQLQMSLDGKATLRVDGDRVVVIVTRGSATATDAKHRETRTLMPGQSLEATVAGMTSPGATVLAGTAGNGDNAGGNGNGNAKGLNKENRNDNGDGNGNGNGSGNGNGKSKGKDS